MSRNFSRIKGAQFDFKRRKFCDYGHLRRSKEGERERKTIDRSVIFRVSTSTTAAGVAWQWHAKDAFYIDSRADDIPSANRTFESRVNVTTSPRQPGHLFSFMFLFSVLLSFFFFFCNLSWTRRAQTDKKTNQSVNVLNRLTSSWRTALAGFLLFKPRLYKNGMAAVS